MKKLILTATSVAILSAALAGCGWNTMDNMGGAVVRTSTGVVNTTGAVVTDTVGGGVAVLTGQPVVYRDMVAFRKHGVIYHNGHTYTVKHGRYVMMH
ncbi:hypothetical protein [Legionella gresilensis]|uniref:hypothetical protein n=1 Tax=Legionella gresilensis TaxID=91823 RepID=UPI001041A825|nr:hypothetical protein [Legionella gresilensis]